MIETRIKSPGMKRCKRTNMSLRNRLEKLFAFLAIMAVILNFLSPVTHGLISQAEAGEFLEICTNQGVQIVQIDQKVDKSGNMDGECDACPDCPLCPVAKSTFTMLTDQGNLKIFLTDTKNEPLFLAEKNGRDDPPWIRPALRAPPFV